MITTGSWRSRTGSACFAGFRVDRIRLRQGASGIISSLEIDNRSV